MSSSSKGGIYIFENDIELRDYAYLKKLGNSYKLIKCNSVRKKGYESIECRTDIDITHVVRKKGFRFEVLTNIDKETHLDLSSPGRANEKTRDHTEFEKLKNNICRARNKILEYVLCNEFKFFVTLTLDPIKYDRLNLKKFIKDLSIFIRDYNKRKNADIKYLFIPEQHIDGCWHMHGFIMGLPEDRLKEFELHGDRNLPPYIVRKLRNDDKLYFFPEYEKKFGWNIFEPIRNKKASVLYMCKYLTKDLSRNVTEYGGHLYYCSKGLKKAEVVKEGQFLDSNFQFDFQNDYGGQSFYDSLNDDDLEELKNKIGNQPISLDEYRKGFRKNPDGFIQGYASDTGEIFGSVPDENMFL